MEISKLSLIFFFILLLQCAIIKADDLQIGAKKLAKIKYLQDQTSNGIIIFDDKSYEDLVFQNPRPYDMVVLYTVASKVNDHCDEVFSEYESAVYSFLKSKSFYSNKDIFFGVVYHGQKTQHIFTRHGYTSVPHLTVSIQKPKRLDNEQFYKGDEDWLIGSDQQKEARIIIDHLNKKLNTNIV